jgi:hypothetical protein
LRKHLFKLIVLKPVNIRIELFPTCGADQLTKFCTRSFFGCYQYFQDSLFILIDSKSSLEQGALGWTPWKRLVEKQLLYYSLLYVDYTSEALVPHSVNEECRHGDHLFPDECLHSK